MQQPGATDQHLLHGLGEKLADFGGSEDGLAADFLDWLMSPSCHEAFISTEGESAEDLFLDGARSLKSDRRLRAQQPGHLLSVSSSY